MLPWRYDVEMGTATPQTRYTHSVSVVKGLDWFYSCVKKSSSLQRSKRFKTSKYFAIGVSLVEELYMLA